MTKDGSCRKFIFSKRLKKMSLNFIETAYTEVIYTNASKISMGAGCACYISHKNIKKSFKLQPEQSKLNVAWP